MKRHLMVGLPAALFLMGLSGSVFAARTEFRDPSGCTGKQSQISYSEEARHFLRRRNDRVPHSE